MACVSDHRVFSNMTLCLACVLFVCSVCLGMGVTVRACLVSAGGHLNVHEHIILGSLLVQGSFSVDCMHADWACPALTCSSADHQALTASMCGCSNGTTAQRAAETGDPGTHSRLPLGPVCNGRACQLKQMHTIQLCSDWQLQVVGLAWTGSLASVGAGSAFMLAALCLISIWTLFF